MPAQSPLYWVQHKERYLRQQLIRDIEAVTSRRLLVYFADSGDVSEIDRGDRAYLAELLRDVADDDPVDLLLETHGGGTDPTEALISLLQDACADIRVIVVGSAKSNGTLLALAGKQIVMGQTSELGPIDPQLRGVSCTVWAQPKLAESNIVFHELGKSYIRQTKSLAKRLLTEGMMAGKDETQIEKVVNALSGRDRYPSHGSVINHSEAVELGLAVQYLEREDSLWKQLWLLHCMYTADARRDGFHKIFEGRKISTPIVASNGQA